MQLYELIIPSEPVSFYAENDAIAFACAVLLGSGKVGCRKTNGAIVTILHTNVAFYADANSIIRENLETELEVFVETHKKEMSNAFKTFAYIKAADRKEYDDACNRIADPVALEEYKHDRENRARKSTAQTGAVRVEAFRDHATFTRRISSINIL